MHASAQVEMQTFTVTVEFSSGGEPYATETYTVEATDWYRAQRDAIEMSVSSRSEEHTSELQSLMRISYAVFCLKKQTQHPIQRSHSSRVYAPPHQHSST